MTATLLTVTDLTKRQRELLYGVASITGDDGLETPTLADIGEPGPTLTLPESEWVTALGTIINEAEMCDQFCATDAEQRRFNRQKAAGLRSVETLFDKVVAAAPHLRGRIVAEANGTAGDDDL